jgi:hypothetical protein
MSLKAFHIFFIIVSILFAFGFGAWGLRAHGAGRDGMILGLAVVSLAAGLGLVVYLVAFVRKLRNPRMM